ncbi:MAG: 3',5'-cyclic-AMP phosphodiesterase [Acaryochloridaceae cyanobacterium SU_2_1]|nr:3',5'-cyclic-AMP phosphodiesterase [Acaryochloridaceae cyanobacterium SU_2_1]
MEQTTSLLVAQLTDLHLFARADGDLMGLNTLASLKTVLQALTDLDPQPQQLILTGDLAQDETQAAYQHLQHLITPLKIPTYWLPGNHDHLDNLAATLINPPFSNQKSYQMGGWHFLLLDSTVQGQVYGQLSSSTLEGLDRALKQASPHPTVIALHHPPLTIHSDWLDQIGLHNAQDFFAILDRHAHVKLVLFGHIHQELACQRQGIHYLSTPSTCIQFAPHSQTFALDTCDPGFRLLNLYADGTFKTEVKRVKTHQALDLSAKGY